MGYLVRYIGDRNIADSSPWVEPGVRARVEAALQAVQTERLKPIFDHLGGEVSFDAIRIVLSCLRNRLGSRSPH